MKHLYSLAQIALFIRLRQNTLRLAAGMNGEVNHGEARMSARPPQ
jgi:hypothetical protein